MCDCSSSTNNKESVTFDCQNPGPGPNASIEIANLNLVREELQCDQDSPKSESNCEQQFSKVESNCDRNKEPRTTVNCSNQDSQKSVSDCNRKFSKAQSKCDQNNEPGKDDAVNRSDQDTLTCSVILKESYNNIQKNSIKSHPILLSKLYETRTVFGVHEWQRSDIFSRRRYHTVFSKQEQQQDPVVPMFRG